MLELYTNIKKLRQKLDMSQEDLAKKTGYTSTSSITKIEKGKVDLPISKIILFAKSLNTTPSDLMGWEEENITQAYTNQTKHPLVQIYDNLNSEGQNNLMNYAQDLSQLSKYKKCDNLSEEEIS